MLTIIPVTSTLVAKMRSLTGYRGIRMLLRVFSNRAVGWIHRHDTAVPLTAILSGVMNNDDYNNSDGNNERERHSVNTRRCISAIENTDN